MSESFDEVYDRIYPQLHNPCGLWKAATIKEWLDDLMTAHDHELEQMRKEIATRYELTHCPACETRLKKLDVQHEVEHASKESFHRGYVAGQRSMDADHAAVAMRLRGLRFDGGSHENLAKLAYAIYPCATGWTCESCDGLRDKIIELLGGIHDEPVPVATSGDADCGDSHRRDGETGRVTYDEPKSCKSGETIKSGGECDGKIMENGENHQIEATITDELREFVDANWPTELDDARIMRETEGSVPYSLLLIADRIDARHYLTSLVAEASTSDEWIAMSEYDELRAELDELRGHSRTCPESGDGVSASAPSVSITDELRECVRTADRQYDDTLWYEMSEDSEADHTICLVTEGELLRVADRIDEWHRRLCEQHEAVLQDTIDDAADECDRLIGECDELQAKLDAVREALDGR